MKWSEIIGSENHAVPVSDIISDAQKRLQEIKQDDTIYHQRFL